MDLKLWFILFCLPTAAGTQGQSTSVKVPIHGTAILPVLLNSTTLDMSRIKVNWTYHGTLVQSFGLGNPDRGEDYRKRASLFKEEIAKGNVSLKLKNVTEKDAGTYTCTVVGENIIKQFNFKLVLHITHTATVNGTTILPVHLRTRLDETMTVRWKFINKPMGTFTNGKSSISKGFKDKASFFEDKIAEGNVSLQLKNITEKDFGNYTCTFLVGEGKPEPRDNVMTPGAIIGIGLGVLMSAVLLGLLPYFCNKQTRLEVNVAQRSYQAEEMKLITLEWNFTPKPDPSLQSLEVHCDMLTNNKNPVLLRLHGGVEISESRDKEFSGRVQWDKDVLREGRIRLNVSSLRTEDSGLYWCLVNLFTEENSDRCWLNVTAARNHIHSTPEPEGTGSGSPGRNTLDGGPGLAAANVTGVTGGAFAFVVVVIFAVYKRCRRNRTYDEAPWEEQDDAGGESQPNNPNPAEGEIMMRQLGNENAK